jgi:hypothetical protein
MAETQGSDSAPYPRGGQVAQLLDEEHEQRLGHSENARIRECEVCEALIHIRGEADFAGGPRWFSDEDAHDAMWGRLAP